MKLRELRDEQAIVALGDIVEHVAMLSADEEVMELRKTIAESGEMSDAERKRMSARLTGMMIRNSPKDIMAILAILNGKDKDDCSFSFSEILAGVTDLLTDDEMRTLFF